MKSGTAAAPRWVLFNPRAGGGKAAQAWRRLQAAEGNRLEGLEVLSGSTAEGAAAALDRRLGESAAALPEGRPRLLVVGGDGTFHLAANRVLEAGLGDRVELALIPAGTGSDLARGLGLPRAPAAALDLALRGGAHPLDALEVRLTAGPAAPGRAFSVNVTSAGLSGVVVESLAGGEHAGRPRGAASYVVESLRAVAGYRPTPLRVRVDGEPVHDGPLFLVAAANGRFFGAGL